MLTLPLGKQAGPDRIPNIVFKLLPKLLAPKLGALLRRAVEKGTLPKQMLHFLIQYSHLQTKTSSRCSGTILTMVGQP